MSNSPTRVVVVDDTDPRIQYDGSGWKLTTAGTTESWGIYGPTFNRTLHETWSDGSFTLKFNGTRFNVHATIDTENGRPRPSWLCNIDGKGTGRVTPDDGQHTNHWVVCDSGDDVLSGTNEHTLKVDVTVPSGATFWLDAIVFSPTTDITEGETLLVQQEDNAITFSPSENWNFTDGITQNTDIEGSSTTFKFTGTSVTFFTVLRPNLLSSTGTYTIDGGSETPFTIPGHNDFNRMFNLPLFSANNLSPEEHTLVTKYTGERNHTPLSLDYFFVTLPPKEEVPEPSQGIGPSGTGSPPPQSSGTTDGKSSTPVGAIVGGVVGGVLGLAAIGLLLFFLRRKRRQEPYQETTPFMAARPDQSPIMPSATLNQPGTLTSPSQYSSSHYNPYATTSVSGATEITSSSALAKQQQALSNFRPEAGVQHVDSGVRLGEPSGHGAEVRDIPPVYTER